MWKVAVAALAISGCNVLGGGTNEPPEAEPPGPAQPAELPAEVTADLPKDEMGRPIMISFGSMGLGVEIVHDATLDDPIARWGECLGRVAACHRANEGTEIAGCVIQIERCASDAGGNGCCPPRCIDDFEAAYERFGDGDRALDETILTGECVDGFPVEVMP